MSLLTDAIAGFNTKLDNTITSINGVNSTINTRAAAVATNTIAAKASEDAAKAFEATALASKNTAVAAQTAINHKYRGVLAANPATRTDGTANLPGDYYVSSSSVPSGLTLTFTGSNWQASDISTANLAAPGGAGLIGWVQSGIGAVFRWVRDKLGETISTADFGAVGDGVTDDSAAVQKAVNHCLTFDPPASLVVVGLTRLGSPVNIDRLVDAATSSTPFRIRAKGKGAFFANTPITMFSSTLSNATDPQSQMVDFDGVPFIASSAALAAYVIDGEKFLRVKFNGANFHRIKVLSAAKYIQTYHFNDCDARQWSGTLIKSIRGAYDVKIKGGSYEHGGPVLSITDPTGSKAAAGCSVIGSLIEGITNGDALTFDNARGVSVLGTYFEGNSGADIALDTAANVAGTSPNLGIKLGGNYHAQTAANLANANYRAVRWGNTVGETGGGWSNGRLNGIAAQTRITTNNDYAELGEQGVGVRVYGTGITTRFVTIPADNAGVGLPNVGEGSIGTYTAHGLVLIGHGTVNDLLVINKNGADTLKIPTGTTNLDVMGQLKHGGSKLVATSVTLPGNFGAELATLSNAPVAGNPTKWVSINDNGVNRFIPVW